MSFPARLGFIGKDVDQIQSHNHSISGSSDFFLPSPICCGVGGNNITTKFAPSKSSTWVNSTKHVSLSYLKGNVTGWLGMHDPSQDPRSGSVSFSFTHRQRHCIYLLLQYTPAKLWFVSSNTPQVLDSHPSSTSFIQLF